MIWKEFYPLACKLVPEFTQSLLYETSVARFTSAITFIKGEVNIHRALQSQVADSLFFFAIVRNFQRKWVSRASDRCAPVRHDLSLIASWGECAAREPLATYNRPAGGEASARPFAQLNLFYRKARMFNVDTGSIVAVK